MKEFWSSFLSFSGISHATWVPKEVAGELTAGYRSISAI
jgi:hypothetical protein